MDRVDCRSLLLVVASSACAARPTTAPRSEPLVHEDDATGRAQWDERMATLRAQATDPRAGDTFDEVRATCTRDQGDAQIAPRGAESDFTCVVGGVVVFECHIADRVVLEGALPEPVATTCRPTR